VKKTLAGHLEFASRLFDVGEVVKAGQIWQAILKREPSCPDALAGLLKVKEALAGRVSDEPDRQDAPSSANDAVPAAPVPAADFDAFLAKGCSLYDKGDPRGALEAWESALAVDPSHALVLSYIRGVRRELGLPVQDGAAPQPRILPAAEQRAPSPHADEVERLLESGVKSYEKGRFEKARLDWEKALALDPDNGLTKGYLGLVRDGAAQRGWTGTQPTRAGSTEQADPIGSDTTQRSMKTNVESGSPAKPRGSERDRAAKVPVSIVRGPALDRQLEFKENQAAPILRLLFGSKLAAWTAVAVVLLVPAFLVVRNVRKDALLVAARVSIRDGAIERAGRSAKVERLMPTVGELCRDARSLLRSDPLRAYLLADEALKLDRLDASAPKLMEDARQAMQEHPAPVPSGNLVRFMTTGDLDGAAALLELQLRRSPSDAKVRENLARVSLLLARACAAQGDWDGARSRLLLGSALFPTDLEWRARLRLLDYLRSVPEDERGRWIGLLG